MGTRMLAWVWVLLVGGGIGCKKGDSADENGDEVRPIPAEVCLLPDCACGAREDEMAIHPVPPDELGHWAAARLELPGTPFEVTDVVFGLAGPTAGGETELCDPTEEMHVQLFVSDSANPPQEPEALWTGSPSVDGDEVLTMVTLPVSPPVVVEDGEELFVSFEMAGIPEGFICLFSCGTAQDAASASWWSNAATPPFEHWATLRDFGMDAAYNVGVDGSVVE